MGKERGLLNRLGWAAMRLYTETRKLNDTVLPWTSQLSADELHTAHSWARYFTDRRSDLATSSDLNAALTLVQFGSKAAKLFGVRASPQFNTAHAEVRRYAARLRTLAQVQRDGVANSVAETVISLATKRHGALLEQRYGSLARGQDALRSSVFKAVAPFVGARNDQTTRALLQTSVVHAISAVLGEPPS